LHGDSYFTLLDEWLDSCLPLGSGLPRDESLIRQSMAQAVIGNPAFESLGKEPRFQNIIRRLEGFRQDNDAK
ncbi:MAG: transcriptional regulator, partial [Lachnospiraceae bacterium]|nr:transcriptional regulator [Lachnospiraceae bacterium]